MITEYIELHTSRVEKSKAAALAREILAACGEAPRGRKLADKQPCGCVLASGEAGRYVICHCKSSHSNAIRLAEDPRAVWEGEADAAAVREAAIREAAEYLRTVIGCPHPMMLSALLPTGKHPQCCEPGLPCKCRCHIAAAQLDGVSNV